MAEYWFSLAEFACFTYIRIYKEVLFFLLRCSEKIKSGIISAVLLIDFY